MATSKTTLCVNAEKMHGSIRLTHAIATIGLAISLVVTPESGDAFEFRPVSHLQSFENALSLKMNLQAFGLTKTCSDYNSFTLVQKGKTNIMGNRPTREKNLEKLSSFLQLGENWNQNGAQSISEGLIEVAKKLLPCLPVEPELFPTANGSIQFEYDSADNKHFDFELYEDGCVEYFWSDNQRNCREEEGTLDVAMICEAIKTLYGY